VGHPRGSLTKIFGDARCSLLDRSGLNTKPKVAALNSSLSGRVPLSSIYLTRAIEGSADRSESSWRVSDPTLCLVFLGNYRRAHDPGQTSKLKILTQGVHNGSRLMEKRAQAITGETVRPRNALSYETRSGRSGQPSGAPAAQEVLCQCEF
jgi:hypothetical protein